MSVKYQFHEAHDLQYQVHFVLSQNPYLAGRSVQCEVSNNEVILRGNVRTYYQKQMAQESLRKINGVGRIKNELSVLAR